MEVVQLHNIITTVDLLMLAIQWYVMHMYHNRRDMQSAGGVPVLWEILKQP